MNPIIAQAIRLAERNGHHEDVLRKFVRTLEQNQLFRDELPELSIEAYCDGGCNGQGLQRRAGGQSMYYSFDVPEAPYGRIKVNRVPRQSFRGAADNNVAELLAARELLHALINRAHLLPMDTRIVIHTDSQVLLGLVEGAYETQSPQMGTLAKQIRCIVRMFASQNIWVSFHWASRERLVEVLGH